MMVAVYSNARTAVSAKKQGEAGWTASFNCAFRAVSGPASPSRPSLPCPALPPARAYAALPCLPLAPMSCLALPCLPLAPMCLASRYRAVAGQYQSSQGCLLSGFA